MRNPRKSPNLRVHGLLDSCFALTRRKKNDRRIGSKRPPVFILVYHSKSEHCVCGAKVTLDLSRATFCAVWAVWKECHLFTHDLYYPVSTFDSFGAVQN